jgi:prefoldin alpha subunit
MVKEAKKPGLDQQKLQEDLYELELIKRRIEAIETQIQTLESLRASTENLLKMLENLLELKKSGSKKPIYVDLGSGIFLKVLPQLEDKLLVRIEETVFIEKSLDEAKQLVENNLKTIDKSLSELNELRAQEILKYNQKLSEITKKYNLQE